MPAHDFHTLARVRLSDRLRRRAASHQPRGSRRPLHRLATAALALGGALALVTAAAQTPEWATPAAGVPPNPVAETPDLLIADASVRLLEELELLLFEITVEGEAGATTPAASGDFDGAPVLGYVVPTTLPPSAVGFTAEEGLVALVAASHADFDDSPLWDENRDGDYVNDGALWHTHWVLVGPDDRVPGGLTVLEVAAEEAGQVLPPTNPGLPLFVDSPGFPVQLRGQTLRIVVPAERLRVDPEFNFDAASVFLQVNLSDPSRPVFGVYDVYSVLSGDLSLPFAVNPRG
jgi:hypothetical protein